MDAHREAEEPRRRDRPPRAGRSLHAVLLPSLLLHPHMKQLVEYVTGMDCRIGYPNEHVAKAVNENLLIPAMSTGVGLIINGLEKYNYPIQSGDKGDKILETPNTSTIKEKQRDSRGPAGFLNRIKEFFDADED